jgi:Family of unknown function (DUF5677)
VQKPDCDRELIDALGAYLRRVTEIVGSAKPHTGFGEALPLVVLLRQLRTATAIVVLIDRGYADDAGPLVRALAAGTISFAALTQTDSDDRGYLFAQHGRDRHLKWSDSVRERNKVLTEKEKNLPPEQRTFRLSEEKMLAARAILEKRWNDQLAAALEGRPAPQPLGGNTRTWHGLDDAEMAKRADALEIYRGIYDVSSDWSHQLFTVMLSVLKELHDSRVVIIGPTYSSATYLAMSVRDCVNRLLADAVRHYGLDVGDEPLQLDQRLTNAIRTYTICKGDQESMARARELLAQEEASVAEPGEPEGSDKSS